MVPDLPTGVVTLLFTDVEAELPPEQLAAARLAAAATSLEDLITKALEPVA